MSTYREFDAIVIGSGIGGLACASIMAKLRKWRVLVLEQHFKLGGFTHTFKRPGAWSWDVGLHYVGEMGEGMAGRRLFDFITDGEVKWNPMPDVYDVFVDHAKAKQISAALWSKPSLAGARASNSISKTLR